MHAAPSIGLFLGGPPRLEADHGGVWAGERPVVMPPTPPARPPGVRSLHRVVELRALADLLA